MREGLGEDGELGGLQGADCYISPLLLGDLTKAGQGKLTQFFFEVNVAVPAQFER